jgi:hypothetical protein
MRGIVRWTVVAALVCGLGAVAAAQERGSSSTTVKDKSKSKSSSKSKGKSKSRLSSKSKSKSSGTTRSLRHVELDVRSYPRGASIVVDGEKVGTAPAKVRVPTGRRVLEMRLSGYAEARTTIKVEPGMGYLLVSLARESSRKVAAAPKHDDKPSSTGFGAVKMDHGDAMVKARRSLKQGDHSDAYKYAQAALASKPADSEAQMIATIASCGLHESSQAKRHLPGKQGSYREIAIKRCSRLGIDLP